MCHTGMWHTVGGRGGVLERALCPTVWDWGIGEEIRLVEWSICMRWEGGGDEEYEGGMGGSVYRSVRYARPSIATLFGEE